MQDYRSIVAVDVGSTTTKAILIEPTEEGHRATAYGVAPTTVEEPHENVMVGVQRALASLEADAGRQLMEDDHIVQPQVESTGADLFIATSSAGGGLQMVVTGLMRELTAESAERAALGAGAIVTDVLSMNDGRLIVERIRRIQDLRPDIILIAGGTNEGNVAHVLSLAEYVAAARPRARYGEEAGVPVVYAGNARARELVQRALKDEVAQVAVVDNIRPTLEEEVLEPVRTKIHELFLQHVMAHAPGYTQLLEDTGQHIQPTPAAVGKILRLMAEEYEANIVGVDIGGATTDVFSVIEGIYNRSVSANIGMSYSVGNVFVQASPENVLRWLPYEVGEEALRDWNYNKMIRPTTLPETINDLLLEHALGREALRLSFQDHHKVAVELKGVQIKRSFDDVFDQTRTGQSLIKPGHVDAIIGSGGLLSHAPQRAQALLLLLDSLQPQGFTRLYVDRAFMMPHLGALSELDRELALEVLVEDCLIPLATVIAPAGKTGQREPNPIADVTIRHSDGSVERETIDWGTLKVLPFAREQRAEFEVVPRGNFDLGDGPGRAVTVELAGGRIGIVLDGRGRPIQFAREGRSRQKQLMDWIKSLDAYPLEALERYRDKYAGEGIR